VEVCTLCAVNMCGHLFLSHCLLQIIYYILDINNFEEDNYAEDTPESVAKYIIDQLLTSVTAPVGRCRSVFIFIPHCQNVTLTISVQC